MGTVCNKIILDGRKAERNNIKTRGTHGYINICTTGAERNNIKTRGIHGYINICTTGLITNIISVCDLPLHI